VACAATEYYLGVGEAPGRWHGRGLDQLGLTAGARVAERELEALFARGLHPQTGERLGRAWRTDAVTGFDLTFSAPKSVSAVWALGDREVAVGVLAAHRAAVEAGLAYLDTHAGLSRRGTDGVEQIGTAGLAVALFGHRTSRAGDPQLHTHALVINKVRCVDGTWRTLDATELFHHKKSAGMIYQAALRNEMQARIGVAFTEADEHGQAEILGMPAGLLALWSKRTAAIDGEAGPKIAHYEQLLGPHVVPRGTGRRGQDRGAENPARKEASRAGGAARALDRRGRPRRPHPRAGPRRRPARHPRHHQRRRPERRGTRHRPRAPGAT